MVQITKACIINFVILNTRTGLTGCINLFILIKKKVGVSKVEWRVEKLTFISYVFYINIENSCIYVICLSWHQNICFRYNLSIYIFIPTQLVAILVIFFLLIFPKDQVVLNFPALRCVPIFKEKSMHYN